MESADIKEVSMEGISDDLIKEELRTFWLKLSGRKLAALDSLIQEAEDDKKDNLLLTFFCVTLLNCGQENNEFFRAERCKELRFRMWKLLKAYNGF